MLVDEEITEHISRCSANNAKDFLFTLIESLNEQDQVKCFVTLWAIWYAKRKAIHEEIYQSPLSTYSFIQSFVNDLESSKRMKKKNVVEQMPVVLPRWKAPPTGFV